MSTHPARRAAPSRRWFTALAVAATMVAGLGTSAQNASAAPQTVRATATTEKITPHGRTWARYIDTNATQRVASQGRTWRGRNNPGVTQRVASQGRTWRVWNPEVSSGTITPLTTTLVARRYTEMEDGRSWR